jgi:putative ABC transport system permease protein
VIGIASVIYLVGVGNGLKANVTSKISGLGATRINVRSQSPGPQTVQVKKPMHVGEGGPAASLGSTSVASLTSTDYQTVKQASNVVKASPEANAQVAVAVAADSQTARSYQLYGVDTGYFGMESFQAQSGTLLSQRQVDDGENVVILGSQTSKNLFPDFSDPVGKTLYIQNVAFTVVGVLKQPDTTSALLGGDPASNLYTGYKQWLSITDNSKFNSVLVDASDQGVVDSAAKSITSVLTKTHNIVNTDESDFNVSTNQQLLSTLSSVTGSFSTALTGIAAISLLVGGIGIMNIMLVTVTERTREIGLRRAVGAKTRHILLQFLLESVLLTLIGGGFGVLLGFAFSRIGARIAVRSGGEGIQVLIDSKTIILAVGVSAAIGIIFGLFPAIKAAKLDPVEALRYE